MDDLTVIGYDTSEDMHTLSVLCTTHGSPGDGTEIYAGDEWGAYEYPTCSRCEAELRDLILVQP